MIDFGERYGDEQKFTVVCDGCPDTYDDMTVSFKRFTADIKSRGWTTRRIGSEWTHFCPDCSEDMGKKAK